MKDDSVFPRQPKTLSDEEIECLESLGLLDLCNQPISSNDVPLGDDSCSMVVSESEGQSHGIWMKVRNFMNTRNPRNEELTINVASELSQSRTSGSSPRYHQQNTLASSNKNNAAFEHDSDGLTANSQPKKILLGLGGTLFLLPHLAILLSLPPVLRRRGAPYLPTFRSKLNVMFDLIKVHIQQPNSIPKHNLTFVDLGSGDGRVVFRAAREGLFHNSVGYEINPTLHIFAQIRKLMTPKYWSNTRFECRDLWNIPLKNYDVVAVYGLSPIMDRLGKKMKEELKPGSIVVSNVFMIPGWRSVGSCKNEDGTEVGGKGVYLYRVPESFSSQSGS
ncbi:hypothetical protein ACHAW6_012638 [Cyclotella cf. meneghiniana]